MSNSKFNSKNSNSKSNKGKRPNKYNKGKANYSKSKANGVDSTDNLGSNAPEWYTLNAQALKDVANIPFHEWVGQPILIGGSGKAFAPPSIISIALDPSVGLSMDANSPINRASQQLWTALRKDIAGNFSFDHSEVMIYCLCVAQLYAMWYWGARSYAAISTYSTTNLDVPNTWALAMGWDPQDLRVNAASLRSYLNIIAPQICRFILPKDIPFLKRYFELYTSVYLDNNTPKSQMYLFRPNTTWMYDQAKYQTGSAAVTYHIADKITYAQYAALVDGLIDALAQSGDALSISSYMLKAFGSNSELLPIVPDIATLNFANDDYVRMQIHNLMISGETAEVTNPELPSITSQNDVRIEIINEGKDQFILHDPVYISKAEPGDNPVSAFRINPILDVGTYEPNEQMVAEATRLMVTAGNVQCMRGSSFDTQYGESLYECAFHVDCGLDTVNSVTVYSGGEPFKLKTSVIADDVAGVKLMRCINVFSNGPRFYNMTLAATASEGKLSNFRISGFTGDLDTFTQPSSRELKDLHRNCNVAAFTVRSII